jgi:hypothetical protein
MQIDINKSDSYIETMKIKPVDCLPDDHYHLSITSQLLSAKNPDELHTRFSTTLSMVDLMRLNGLLSSYIQKELFKG